MMEQSCNFNGGVCLAACQCVVGAKQQTVYLVLLEQTLNSACESFYCLVLLLHHLRQHYLDITHLYTVFLEVVHGVMVLLT